MKTSDFNLYLVKITLIYASNPKKKAILVDHSISPKKIILKDNLERHLFDYSISDDIGLNKMHAPIGWTEPIIKAQFEIRGIVLSGQLGLEFKEGIKKITMVF